MRRATFLKATGVLAACAVLCLASRAPAEVQRGASKEIQLTYKAGTIASKTFTPAKSKFGGKPFRINGAQGALSLGGQSVLFGVRYAKALKAYYGALDTDGNGELESKEFVKFSQTMSANFKIKLGEEDYAVRIANVRVYPSTGGPTTSIYGGYVINACHTGTFDNIGVRLFDDNLDGTFTQDGEDAIAIGRGQFAIPLGKVHQIGDQHYELEVSEDGKKLSFTPLSGLELGIVEVSFKRGLRSLAFYDDESGNSYDLATSAKTGIPAGKYKLAYGVLTAGKFATVVQPTKKSPVYEIEAGKINTIRLGKPIRVSFSANYSNQTVTVSPSVKVFGAGGEEYAFDYSGGTGRPHVLLFEGKRVLSRSAMEYG